MWDLTPVTVTVQFFVCGNFTLIHQRYYVKAVLSKFPDFRSRFEGGLPVSHTKQRIKIAFLLAAVGTRLRPQIIVGAIPDPHSQIWRGCCCKLPPAAQLKWKRIQVPKGMEGTKSIPSREPNISHPSRHF